MSSPANYLVLRDHGEIDNGAGFCFNFTYCSLNPARFLGPDAGDPEFLE